MGFRLAGTLLAAALAFAAGCATRGRVDLLESRLRQQEDSIATLESDLSRSQSHLEAARREAADLRTRLASAGDRGPIEQTSALGQATGISLNKFLTGGLDRDSVPGDELLSALVVPSDADGNLVKVPGDILLSVLDLSKPEHEQLVGRWEFKAAESEQLWHSGFLGSGYVLRVPWQRPPQSSNLLLHARLTTTDGRQFDTSQSIHVNPPPAGTTATAGADETGMQRGAANANGAAGGTEPAAPATARNEASAGATEN
jgi:outer membrane murein-binding lipoprotein Lpp